MKKQNPFKVGDRVKVYQQDVNIIGTVCAGAMPDNEWIRVQCGPINFIRPHWKQCRKLKLKPKSIRVTKESLAKAWDKISLTGHENSEYFQSLCKSLGLA